jgi:hypothetical protein
VTQSILKAAVAGCICLTPASETVTVCLAARGTGGTMPSLYCLQLSNDLAESFLLTAATTLRDLHHDIAKGDRTLETYDAGNVPDKHEVEFHTPPAGSTPEAVVKALSTLQQLPVFDGKAATINGLVFHVIAIQRIGWSAIYLFRKYSKTKELGRSKKLVTLFSGGAFDKITEPVFIFDGMVDCIAVGGQMAILNKDSYHRIFQFFTEALQHAQQTLTQIQGAVPIDNAAQFEADCRSNALILVRLRGIADRNYFSSLSLATLEKKIKADGLPIQVSEIGRSKKLVYDPQHRWKFLRLLNDGFLNSDMTGQIRSDRQAVPLACAQ